MIMNSISGLEKVIKAGRDYESATGIKCTVIDSSGNIISNSKEAPVCSQCKFIQKENTGIELCGKIHLYGIYQAEKFGGKYIYFCSLSLMYWVSPIISDGIIKGGLVCGPVLPYKLEDFLFTGFGNHYVHTPNQKAIIMNQLGTLPYINPSRVNSLSEILFMTASFLSDLDYMAMKQGESTEQQSEISSYIQYIKSMECNPEQKNRYPIEKERELLNQISNADTQGAKKTLNEILGSVFFSSGNNFAIVKSRVLELVVLLSRAALEGGADVEQIFGLNFKYLNKIHTFTKVEELSYWLSAIMVRFTNLVFTLKSIKHTDAIYKAIHFMRNNYSKKITLENVAAEVLLSPAYFSKIFKEQTGNNFSQYLNNLRVDKSKSLLRNSTIALIDIADMVGYEDQSYFTKVFKKITGSSPGKYRDTRGLTGTDKHAIHSK